MDKQTIFSADLAGIVVGETAISDVNGQEGILSYRGHSIETLVDKPFWQVVWLVLFGQWPDLKQETALGELMALHSQLDKAELALLKALPTSLHPMLMLQGIVPLLNLTPKLVVQGISETAMSGLIIAAKLPSLVAAWRQLELGNEPVKANIEAQFHENFLMMFNTRAPSAQQIQVINSVQIMQIEHSFNAGTFAGRVCTSTKAPIQSSIAVSIGTLFGVLHGGADQAALEMAEEIGAPEKAEDFVRQRLEQKNKIMGMGHREYRTVDPRATLIKPMAEQLCSSGKAKVLFDTLVVAERACQQVLEKQGKSIWANVDFYKGAVYHQLGVPSKYFTALFAMARVYGYIAHYLEFSEDIKLIRPRARYVGD
jgi:citrate synthase